MKLNSKIRYGLRTMIEIANHPEGILQKDIAVNQSISVKYLDQIVAGLKTAGLIVRVTGKSSGYKLSASAEKITVYDVYTAFEHKLNISDCSENNENCPLLEICQTRNYWCDLNKEIMNSMKNKTLTNIILS